MYLYITFCFPIVETTREEKHYGSIGPLTRKLTSP